MSWIARLITLALIAVLADATFATVQGPIPALAGAGAGAALTAIALAICWRRPWIAVAFGVFFLTGAFAFTTLGGVGSGPALTGLTASDAAALVLAIAIVAGAVAEWLALPNMIPRTVVVVFSAFALVTTAASVQHGGLAAAFSSAPLAWTRGPYIAAEILLPLAALIALVYGIALLARKRGPEGAAALVLALALLAGTQLGAHSAGQSGLPTIVAFEPTSALGAGGAANTGAAETGSLFVPQGSDAVPAEVSAAYANLPKDPQHALAAVAALDDDLYPGALGGSAGALRSGGANSVDKALLLRDVLRVGSPDIVTVFAQCSLPPDQSDALIGQARAAKGHPKILMQDAVAGAPSVASPKARALAQHWADAWKTIIGQAQSDGSKLSSSLQAAGVALPPGLPTQDALRALVARHVWVRAQVGGSWVDLDPTIEPAALGKTRCTPNAQSATLPDDLYDVLGVRIAVEQLQNGALQRTTLLDRAVRTADIGDRQVSFMFAEPTGMNQSASSASAAPSGPMTFTPLLLVGEESVAGTPIVLPPPSAGGNVGKSASGAAQSVASLFGSSSPSPSPVPTPALPTVTGLWMELSVVAPASTTTQVESPIFDRVGFAARASQTAPPIAAQPDADVYRSMQTVWSVAVSGGHAVSGAGPSSVGAGGSGSVLGGALARLNGAYYDLRRAIMDDGQGASVNVAAVQPGISLVALNNDGTLMSDIASDSTLPLTPGETRPAWAASSVLAERELLNGDVVVTGTGAANDALGEFDVDAALKTPLVALRPGSPAPQSTAIPSDARARISAYLSRGAFVLAAEPAEAQNGGPPYAFWIVDPVLGTLRDENAFGRHQEPAEETETTEEVAVKPISKWRVLACRAAVAVMVWSTQDSSAAEGKTFEAAIETVEEAEDKEASCDSSEL